jgi:hypothetical protein
VSPLELVDDRFEQLARELRAARPVASEPLRTRVHALEPPPPPRRPSLRLRRVVPAVALGTVAVSLSVAVGIGLVHSGSTPTAQRGRLSVTPSADSAEQQALRAAKDDSPLTTTLAPNRSRSAGAFTLDRARLQQFQAVLTLRVDDRSDLSARTSQAMRLTRALGGYVASAVYNVPGKRGASSLVLRIPVDRVQQAIEVFSGYGTLVSQRISVKDVQRRVDDLGSTLGVLRKDIARIQGELAGSVTPARRAELEQRLATDRRRVKALISTKQAITKRAELARVSLTLVTPRVQAVAAKSRFERTIDDAGSVLARELEILLYTLVVLGPLLAVGGVAIAAGRAQRRRSDRRLLERA